MSEREPIERACRAIAKVCWRRDSMHRRDANSADEFADNYWLSYEEHARAAVRAYLRAYADLCRDPYGEYLRGIAATDIAPGSGAGISATWSVERRAPSVD